MIHRSLGLSLVMTAACLGVVLSAGPAAAIGYYNLPGNFCQWCGYGNGTGYHSCLVLGPSTCYGACSPNEIRLSCPPQPPCYGCGSYGQGYYASPPYELQYVEPAPQPAGAEYIRTPAAMRPQILR